MALPGYCSTTLLVGSMNAASQLSLVPVDSGSPRHLLQPQVASWHQATPVGSVSQWIPTAPGSGPTLMLAGSHSPGQFPWHQAQGRLSRTQVFGSTYFQSAPMAIRYSYGSRLQVETLESRLLAESSNKLTTTDPIF